MRRAVIVNPLRTPVGTFGGTLRPVPAEDLATIIVREVVQQSGIDAGLVDDVSLAQSDANSEAPCIGRWAALNAGLPIEVPGMQVDRRCGGGLQAILNAAMQVQTGVADIVVAGGVESMSNVEHYTQDARWGRRAGGFTMHDRLDRGRERSQPTERFGVISGMIETAENIGTLHGIGREEADAYAAESHRRAQAAWDRGAFENEVVPVTVPQRKGDAVTFRRDEGIRPETTVERLAALRTVVPGGTVTAGNASQQNDAAAACLVMDSDTAERLDLEPLAYLETFAAAGCDPALMGIGPVPAVEKLFARSGLSFDDLDLVELNEAFAVQVLGVLKGWGWDDRSRLNVNGSGISLGHPVGATGARMTATALHELRRRKGERALVTMCIGGGQGLAAVFRRA